MRLLCRSASVLLLDLLLGVTAAQHLHSDRTSVQATFVVPCSGCRTASAGLPNNNSFQFDLEAFPTETACGSTNLTLNGIPLHASWESAGVHAQGQQSVPASGHDLKVHWYLDCLFDSVRSRTTSSSAGDAQLLTLAIDQVDRRDITSQLAGFTVSFKQHSTPPELLRLSLQPDFTAKDPEYSTTWRNPPEDLRVKPSVKDSPTSSTGKPSLEDQVDDLRRLEAELELLAILVEAKREAIKLSVKGELNDLKSDIHRCDGFVCVIKALVRKAHGAVKLLYRNFRPNPYREQILQGQTNFWNSAAGGQYRADMETIGSSQTSNTKPLPTRDLHPPMQAHCNDGKPGSQAPQWNEKSNSTASEPLPSAFRESRDPSFLAAFFKVLLVLTGLAALSAFLRRRCCSLRTRTDRAARREQRRTERAYRRSARRQALSDWWHGRGRVVRRGRGPRDIDEKRDLVEEQEGILEESMQDEIRQLQIAEEIRRFRSTHNTVDELVRAEEGRSRGYRHAVQYRQTRDAGPAFVPGPISITIPPPSSTSYPSADNPPSPLSRTSSLPDYRSDDEMSHPPSYHTDDDTPRDSLSDYSPSSALGAGSPGAWTPTSSIPDISPRPSIETTRTFL